RVRCPPPPRRSGGRRGQGPPVHDPRSARLVAPPGISPPGTPDPPPPRSRAPQAIGFTTALLASRAAPQLPLPASVTMSRISAPGGNVVVVVVPETSVGVVDVVVPGAPGVGVGFTTPTLGAEASRVGGAGGV